MTQQEPIQLVSPGEFSRRLGLSRWSFYAWRKAGIIPTPHIHKGKISRWHETVVTAFIAGQEVQK